MHELIVHGHEDELEAPMCVVRDELDPCIVGQPREDFGLGTER